MTNRKCEQEYIERVESCVISLKSELNNPPVSLAVKDESALEEANRNIDGASQKLNCLKTGAIILGACGGALVGAKFGLSFGPFYALACAIAGAVYGGFIGAGIAYILIDVLKLLEKAQIQWKTAYGIRRIGCS